MKKGEGEEDDEESELIWQRMKTVVEERAPRSEKKRRKPRVDGSKAKNKRN